MTSLTRPLPLNVVVVLLAAACIAGFVMGLRGALVDHGGGRAVSTAPLAEVSGVPVREATPVVATVAPPPVEKPKVKPVEVVEQAPVEEAPVVAAPATDAAPAPVAPVEAPPQPPAQRIEDLY